MNEDHEAPILERARARFRQIVEKAHLLDLLQRFGIGQDRVESFSPVFQRDGGP